jgi:ABC-2 type transport system ATP-binding protein
VRFDVVANDSHYAIETFSLTKVFPDWWGRAKVVAVEQLSLKIRHNEIYGLLGPNGSGKTTTLKILLNLLYPTKGRVAILSGSAGDPKINARIGYLPEDSYLYRYLTARETLDFYGRIFNLPAKVRKSRIDTLLEMVGLTAMANRPVGTYSKGMARRIGLAQALINDPSLLILDEPTSGMDPIGTRQMKDLLVQLARRGKTILLCSHLLADVEDVCDRIGILYGGRMQVEGDVRSLLQSTEKKQILTGPISNSAMRQIEQILRKEKTECQITSPMDKLEEFFVRTVTAAQEQKQPTSGAISTTEITGFLAEDQPPESILDKLVTASVASDSTSASTGDTETESVQEIEPEPQADSELLERLTKKVDQPPVVQTEQTQRTEPVEMSDSSAEQVKRNVLDELTHRNEKPDGSTEPTDQGRSGDNKDA